MRARTAVKPMRFDDQTDLPPIPFDEEICRLAREMKELGLAWTPHVGCFVWDPDHHIEPESPFPGRIYFILSLPRFSDLLGGVEAVAEKLVWLPTWHQSRLLCRRLAIADERVLRIVEHGGLKDPCEDLGHVYRTLIDELKNE